jgi:putative MATE family efflux protein
MHKYLTYDKEFFSTLFTIAWPIALQQFIMSALNFVDVAMIGQLGESSVAGVGLANQISFLFMLTLFGITSGTAIFTAQFWGKKDIASLRKALGISLSLSIPLGLLFGGAALLVPERLLAIYSQDPEVVALGSQYLQRVGWAYLAMSVTFTVASVLRSTGNTRLPMVVSVCALSLNVLMSYALIFGHFGLPAMGVTGAAAATVIARYLEFGAMIFVTYRFRTAAAARLHELFSFNRAFFKGFLKISMPVVINEVIWALGITSYSVIYARMGTEAIAAVNIANSVDSLAFVFFIALANASAIMVGNRIGAGEEATAYEYGLRFLKISVAAAVVVGLAIFASSEIILTIYKVSPTVTLYARNILWVLAAALWMKTSNLMFFIGILRSGGDTRFTFVLDSGSIWLFGVPMAYLGAFVLNWPVYYVVVLILLDEVFKLILVLLRFTSKKWINNLTVMPAVPGAPEL